MLASRDAAHPMVPFLGQGGCLAVEDAYCLASLIKDKEDLSSIVLKYDRLRNSRSRWIQKRSKLQGYLIISLTPYWQR